MIRSSVEKFFLADSIFLSITKHTLKYGYIAAATASDRTRQPDVSKQVAKRKTKSKVTVKEPVQKKAVKAAGQTTVAKKKAGAKKTATAKASAKKAASTGKKASVAKSTATAKSVSKPALKSTAKKNAVKKSATKKSTIKASATKKVNAKRKSSPAAKSAPVILDRVAVDLTFIGSKDESAEARNTASRARVRSELDSQVEMFLNSGGQIENVAPNVMGDPPKKPESNYGSRPI